MGGLVGLLLAAGRSTRFGSDKLLHRLPDGRSLLQASLAPLAAAADRVLVLVRPGPSPLYAHLVAEGIPYLEVPQADLGMGSTLAFGIRATAQAEGWLVGLADMPCLAPGTAARIAHALKQGALVAAPYYQGRRGHPVGFAACWQAELAALHGDQGARALLQEAAAQIEAVEVNDPGCLLDIDTPADLSALGTRAAAGRSPTARTGIRACGLPRDGGS